MSATGMCRHNNIHGYCPSCVRERSMKGMGRLGSYSDFAGGMAPTGTYGAETSARRALSGPMGACPEGYYDLKIFGVSTGQCAPSLTTLTSGAQSGALQAVASGTAQSPATAQAVQSAAASAIGSKIVNFYKSSPALAWGLTLGGAALLIYGGMSFLRGK